jgi:hypothetical protein
VREKYEELKKKEASMVSSMESQKKRETDIIQREDELKERDLRI